MVKFVYSPLDHICDKNIKMWSMETTDLDQLGMIT